MFPELLFPHHTGSLGAPNLESPVKGSALYVQSYVVSRWAQFLPANSSTMLLLLWALSIFSTKFPASAREGFS